MARLALLGMLLVLNSAPSHAAQKSPLRTFVQDVYSAGIDHDFQNGRIAPSDMIRFGIYQVALRRPQLFRNGKEGRTRLAANHVNAVTRRFFGKTIRPRSVGDWRYQNGFYNGYEELFEQLAPEPLQHYQVKRIDKTHMTIYADFVNAMASSDSEHDVVDKIKLTVRILASKGQPRYLLTGYQSLTPRS